MRWGLTRAGSLAPRAIIARHGAERSVRALLLTLVLAATLAQGKEAAAAPAGGPHSTSVATGSPAKVSSPTSVATAVRPEGRSPTSVATAVRPGGRSHTSVATAVRPGGRSPTSGASATPAVTEARKSPPHAGPAASATALPAAAPRNAAASRDSQACGACHAREHELWHGSDHDRAMMAVSETGAVLGDFDNAVFERDGMRASFLRRKGRYIVEITEKGAAPETFEIAYTFGVDPLQQYLVKTTGGKMQALTIAWDARANSAGGQRWYSLHEGSPEPPPGDPLHWQGAAFRWNTMCADCHSTGVVRGFDATRQIYETRFELIDVGCVACHQPHATEPSTATRGQEDAPRENRATPAARKWVMDEIRGIARLAPNPAPATRPEIETCAPCHSRRASLAAAAAAPAPFLDAHRPSLLDEGLYQADGQIEDEVFEWGSFLQSRMHAAGVTCSDCHDPHALKLRAEGNALCGRCHMPARFDTVEHHFHSPGSKGAQCVACHMPEHTYMGIDARHDHGLRVPRPDLAISLGVPEPCTACHSGRDAAWAAAVIAEKHGPPTERRPLFPAVLAAARDGAPEAAALLAALARDPDEPAIARATALSLLPPDAEPQASRVVEKSASDKDPLLRLGAALALENLPTAERVRIGSPLLSDPLRAIRLEAATALVDAPRAGFDPPALRALEHALAELHESARYNADQPGSHLNLGLLALRSGDFAAAEKHYEAAIDLAPWFVPAWVNLADLKRSQGNDGAAEETLRRGARSISESADIQSALGLTLVRLGRRDEAAQALQRAATLAADDPRHAWLLAVALDSFGSPAEARQVVEQALIRHPRNAALRALLVR